MTFQKLDHNSENTVNNMNEKKIDSVKAANTQDGSKTIFSPNFNEHYHSINGAFTETMHIFVGLGYNSIPLKNINILEIGYGTGLNAICTYLENVNSGKQIFYHGIEKYPLDMKVLNSLNYSEICKVEEHALGPFFKEWNKRVKIDEYFTLYKQVIDFQQFKPEQRYDLIYFDAFSPDVQPEMWSFENLEKILTALSTGGVFVTYCSRGDLKRSLRALGMEVKRFSGPPGKRHVIRATKQ